MLFLLQLLEKEWTIQEIVEREIDYLFGGKTDRSGVLNMFS